MLIRIAIESSISCIKILTRLRQEIGFDSKQSLFMFVGKDLLEIGNKIEYLKKLADEDGLVYITYAEYDVFG